MLIRGVASRSIERGRITSFGSGPKMGDRIFVETHRLVWTRFVESEDLEPPLVSGEKVQNPGVTTDAVVPIDRENFS